MAREKHVVCGVFGTIYFAPINKDHTMGDPRYEFTTPLGKPGVFTILRADNPDALASGQRK